jgi:hypothetical protein
LLRPPMQSDWKKNSKNSRLPKTLLKWLRQGWSLRYWMI